MSQVYLFFAPYSPASSSDTLLITSVKRESCRIRSSLGSRFT